MNIRHEKLRKIKKIKYQNCAEKYHFPITTNDFCECTKCGKEKSRAQYSKSQLHRNKKIECKQSVLLI